MTRVFRHGGLRLYLLSLLDEGPKTGYELMTLLEERFLRLYRPSAGTIYPRLTALEEAGLVMHREVEGRKIYEITEAGRAELARRRDEIEAIVSGAAEVTREVAREIRQDVRASVASLRQEMRAEFRSSRHRRADEGHAGDEHGGEHRWGAERRAFRRRTYERPDVDDDDTASSVEDQWDRLRDDLVDDLESVWSEVRSLVEDIGGAIRDRGLDKTMAAAVRDAVIAAKHAVLDVLGDEPAEGEERAESAEDDQPGGAGAP
jgi:DNA-binding PadR family transcriptional regulator